LEIVVKMLPGMKPQQYRKTTHKVF